MEVRDKHKEVKLKENDEGILGKRQVKSVGLIPDSGLNLSIISMLMIKPEQPQINSLVSTIYDFTLAKFIIQFI